MPDRQSFETTWPPVARRLQAALRHRKVPRAMTEDLVQETGLRLFQIWNRVDPNREIWPLALTIALNILRDHIRTQSRRTQIAIPDAQLDYDTEAIALARVELEQVHAALDQLTDGQRSALLAEIGAADRPDESASSLKMLRLRGRKRLRALIDGASAAVASFELALQRAWRSTPASPLSEQLVPCVSVAAGLLCAASLGGIGTTAGDHPALDTHKGSISSHAAPNTINWLDQSMSLAMTTGSSAFMHDVVQTMGGFGATRDEIAGGGEVDDRRVVINPQGPDGRQRRPRTGPRPDGVRVHNPRAKVGPQGYRVSGGGTADVGGQRVEVEGTVKSGNDEGTGLISQVVPGAGSVAPEASASIDAGRYGSVEYSSSGERAEQTSSPAFLEGGSAND